MGKVEESQGMGRVEHRKLNILILEFLDPFHFWLRLGLRREDMGEYSSQANSKHLKT